MQNAAAMRFPMTLSSLVKAISAFTFVLLAVVVPVQWWVVSRVPVPFVRIAMGGVICISLLGLLFLVLIAPRAVRLDGTKLSIERLGWSDFVVPLRQVTRVEAGPAITMLSGDVRRVAGNGGVLGFTGLFHVKDLGLVRCWATRLDRPTVLIHRMHERPVMLGVDDAPALLSALQARVGASPSGRVV
jgi:Bacterial PH domain